MEGEKPTIMMIQETDPRMKDTNQIGLGMVYQVNIANYIKRSIQFNKNLRKMTMS